LRPVSDIDRSVKGRLYVVATPIGHLEDLSPRAAHTLAEVDLIAAEDTRRTRKLVARLGLKVRMISYHEHNQAKAGPKVLKALDQGQKIALVTDAGTPALSDPGRNLVRKADEAGIEVVPIPGPSAVTAALSVSGMPADRFSFGGFPPAKAKARREFLETLAGRQETLVFFEAPHRLAASLAEMARVLGPRPVVLCRELTKLNEEVRRADLDELRDWAETAEIKGEVTLVVAGAPEEKEPPDRETVCRAWAECREKGLSASQAAREVAKLLGVPRAEVYRMGMDEEE